MYRLVPKVTYVGIVAEVLELIVVEGGGEAVEAARVGVVGIRLDGADGRGDGGGDGVRLHADNELVLDLGAATGDDDGSRVVALGVGVRSRQGHGEEGEKSGRTHLDGLECLEIEGIQKVVERMNVCRRRRKLCRDWRGWSPERKV